MLQFYSPLTVEVEECGGTTLMTLTGEIDESNLDDFIDAVGRICPPARSTVMVDIGELEFLGACGVQALIFSAWRLKLSNSHLVIARSRPITRRVLRALGADPEAFLLEHQAPYADTAGTDLSRMPDFPALTVGFVDTPE